MRHSSTLLVLALLSAGCSWTRFDDIVEGSPIVLLNTPKDIDSGFGTSLATGNEKAVGSVRGDAILLVGGAALSSGAAEFNLGDGNSPTLDARDSGHCMGGTAPCYFSNSPVALTGADAPGDERELCFVDGAGFASDDPGLVVRCTDDVEYAMPIPDDPQSLLDFSIGAGQPTLFRFGSDHGYRPAVLATADEETKVWYYPPFDRRGLVELPNPADGKGNWDEDQARNLTIARVGDGRLLAVGVPEERAVRLFYAPDAKTPSYIGCLGGTSGFGRALASGPVLDHDGDGLFHDVDNKNGDGTPAVSEDDTDDLVISDDSLVYVFNGAQLATLEPTASTDCSLGALPAGTLITSFTCGSTKNISGCSSSGFGAALAVGDLDGDGDGEVVVGAPNMTVRHVNEAGAVIIYDVEPPVNGKPDELFRFKDIAFLSSADQGDRLGSSIALPLLEQRQLLAVGAPGGAKAALFYCPAFLPAALKGSRCQ